MKAVHLASFNGNIGDIANHAGFWNLFRKYVTDGIEVTYLEIREYYKSWHLRKFDDTFADMVNEYDLLVMGGGRFFDVKWEYSRTGTTIDLPESILEKIRIPIVINGMGVDYSPENCSEDIKNRFGAFIRYLDSRKETVVSVRNDNSLQVLKRHFLGNTPRNVIEIPDGGFFTKAGDYSHPEIPANKTIVSINVANDRINDRWGNIEAYKLYCEEFGKFIDKVLEHSEVHFVFVPHIPSDIQAVYDILQFVPDHHRRRNITVAPYLNGLNTPGDYLVDIYKKSVVTIGMRYHANICSIAMGTPTIGIVTLEQHKDLYRNIGAADRLFNVREVPFSDALYDKLFSVIRDKENYIEQNKQIVSMLEMDSVAYYKRIRELLSC